MGPALIPSLETAKQWLTDLQSEALPTLTDQRRPWITLAYAQSLDGCLTDVQGRPSSISGEEALRLTHLLRATHDAILVGIGTVLADNPQLTVRFVEGKNPQPLILDTHLKTPLESKLMQRQDSPPWIFTSAEAAFERQARLEAAGARIVALVKEPGDPIPLEPLLRYLWEQGIRSLMVEGGAKILTTFLAAGLFDLAVITLAPLWIGGYHITDKLLIDSERHVPGLQLLAYQFCHHNLVLWGRPLTYRL